MKRFMNGEMCLNTRKSGWRPLFFLNMFITKQLLGQRMRRIEKFTTKEKDALFLRWRKHTTECGNENIYEVLGNVRWTDKHREIDWFNNKRTIKCGEIIRESLFFVANINLFSVLFTARLSRNKRITEKLIGKRELGESEAGAKVRRFVKPTDARQTYYNWSHTGWERHETKLPTATRSFASSPTFAPNEETKSDKDHYAPNH
ncbi:hypothetical protein Ddc_01033 [Ditylenchus destructor]|nr:hypothetical protein Ddc_01033 [Ditylenchus destructor]